MSPNMPPKVIEDFVNRYMATIDDLPEGPEANNANRDGITVELYFSEDGNKYVIHAFNSSEYECFASQREGLNFLESLLIRDAKSIEDFAKDLEKYSDREGLGIEEGCMGVLEDSGEIKVMYMGWIDNKNNPNTSINQVYDFIQNYSPKTDS